MKYEPVGKHVTLSQGMVVNKSTAHLFSDIKDEDHIYPLLRIVDFENGNHGNYSKYVSKSVPEKVVIDENAILFTRVTCQCFRGFKGVFHNNLFKVELTSDELIEDYLYVILQSDYVKKQALNLVSSSVVPDLTHDLFKSIKIPIPDKDVQKKISKIVLDINKKIEINNSICSELNEMIEQIHEYCFLQYDFPNDKGKPYKTSGGKMKFSIMLNKMIPENWEEHTLRFYLDCNKHAIGKGVHLAEINYLNTGSLTENELGDIQTIQKKDVYPSRAKRVVRENDILYSTVRPEQKHFGIIMKPKVNMIASTGFAVLSSKENTKYNALFYLYIINDSVISILNTIANSSVSSYPSINSDDILNIPIALPNDLSMFTEVVELFNSTFMKITEIQEENKELQNLKIFMEPLLLTGQVKL